MKKPAKDTAGNAPESYEGTPAKLLPAIITRLTRKEPELDELAARLSKGRKHRKG